jgi:uncharacterized protein YbaR (Trm112 family)
MISKELLKILSCARCRGELSYLPEMNTLTCRKCGRVYRVHEDVPVMIDEDDRGLQ